MILSRPDILRLWKSKKIRFEPDIEESQISLCSIDLRVGDNFSKQVNNPGITIDPTISLPTGLFAQQNLNTDGSYSIKQNELVLVPTFEKITLPNDIAAMVEGRSTFARWGLSAHVTAPLINPGWFGQITLEMYNHGTAEIKLWPSKTKACQLILFKLTKPLPTKMVDALSRYRGQTTPEPKPYTQK